MRIAVVGERETAATTERIFWDGRVVTATWLAPPFRPPRRLTTQVLGLCFTQDSQILLVSAEEENWTLPGGPPEAEETLEAALDRELRQEARARLIACAYLGCQRVEDPGRPDGPALYYQARFWARVALYPFDARHENAARHLVSPDAFLNALAWGHTPSARHILAEGLRHERVATDAGHPAT